MTKALTFFNGKHDQRFSGKITGMVSQQSTYQNNLNLVIQIWIVVIITNIRLL